MCQYTSTNPPYFSLQVKNKPLEPLGAMRLFLRLVLSRTVNLKNNVRKEK
jgi:hypothetical protein